MSQVHWTSFAVNGCPSCQRTPSRKRKVSSVPSSFHDQPVARSGTIDCSVFCGTCWSKMTRLLNTAIIGATVEIVTSSRVDMLAGLSRWATRSTPPACCASAGAAPARALSAAIAANLRKFIPLCVQPCLSSMFRAPTRAPRFARATADPFIGGKMPPPASAGNLQVQTSLRPSERPPQLPLEEVAD